MPNTCNFSAEWLCHCMKTEYLFRNPTHRKQPKPPYKNKPHTSGNSHLAAIWSVIQSVARSLLPKGEFSPRGWARLTAPCCRKAQPCLFPWSHRCPAALSVVFVVTPTEVLSATSAHWTGTEKKNEQFIILGNAFFFFFSPQNRYWYQWDVRNERNTYF